MRVSKVERLSLCFEDDSSKKMLGVIAQELESISPGLVEDIPDKEENSEAVNSF